MPKRVPAGGLDFNSKEAARQHCRQILHGGDLGTEIEREHWPFLEALLYSREEKVAELKGRRPVRYLRRKHGWPTTCFFVELDDGDVLDFSFEKSIAALAEREAAG